RGFGRRDRQPVSRRWAERSRRTSSSVGRWPYVGHQAGGCDLLRRRIGQGANRSQIAVALWCCMSPPGVQDLWIIKRGGEALTLSVATCHVGFVGLQNRCSTS